jgi:amidase
MDAHAIVAAVRDRLMTPLDAVAGALARIADDRHNAVVTIASDALDRARAVDPAAPLAGVPFTVKDTIATAGVRTTAGSRLFAHNIPALDAPVVAQLRAAGAVLVGKTNCPEFALQARTDNLLFGATTNPRDSALSAGGSSGGCAAAVAAGLVPFSIGGDYGGSIRYPAACTGIYGLRPGTGTIPAAGTLPEAPTRTPRHTFQTVGPLAASIDDLALVFEILTGPPAQPDLASLGIVTDGWPVAADVAGALAAVWARAEEQQLAPACVDAEPFMLASAAFDAWRATDTFADLRALVAGREAELTPHIRTLLANAPRAEAELAPVRAEAAIATRLVAGALATTPVIALPIALVGALPATGSEHLADALQMLEPARAVSLLGLPALALPSGVQLVSAPGNEAALFSVARLLR